MNGVLEPTPAPAKRPAIETHFVRWDAPSIGRGQARAECGALVDRRREHDLQPTCAMCRQRLAEYEAMEF